MSYLQELLDFVKERGGDVEAARKAVLDSAAALGISIEGVSSAILRCMRCDESVNTAGARKERKNERR